MEALRYDWNRAYRAAGEKHMTKERKGDNLPAALVILLAALVLRPFWGGFRGVFRGDRSPRPARLALTDEGATEYSIADVYSKNI